MGLLPCLRQHRVEYMALVLIGIAWQRQIPEHLALQFPRSRVNDLDDASVVIPTPCPRTDPGLMRESNRAMLPEKGFSDYEEAKRTAQEAGGRPGPRPSSHSRIDEEMRAGVRRFLVIEYLGIGVSGYLRFSPQWLT